jgi:hypothetical protein
VGSSRYEATRPLASATGLTGRGGGNGAVAAGETPTREGGDSRSGNRGAARKPTTGGSEKWSGGQADVPEHVTLPSGDRACPVSSLTSQPTPGAVHPGLKKRERSIVQFSVLVFDHFDQSNFEVNFAKSIFSFLIKPQVFWLVSLKSGLTRCVDVPNQRAVFLSVFIFYFHIFYHCCFSFYETLAALGKKSVHLVQVQ